MSHNIRIFARPLTWSLGLLLTATSSWAQTPQFMSFAEADAVADPLLGATTPLVETAEGIWFCPITSAQCVAQLRRIEARDLPLAPAPPASAVSSSASHAAANPIPSARQASPRQMPLRARSDSSASTPTTGRRTTSNAPSVISFDDEFVSGARTAAEGDWIQVNLALRPEGECAEKLSQFHVVHSQGNAENSLQAYRELYRCTHPCISDRDLEATLACENVLAFLREEEGAALSPPRQCDTQWRNHQVLLGAMDGMFQNEATGQCESMREQIHEVEFSQRKNFQTDLILAVDGSSSMYSSGAIESVKRGVPELVARAGRMGHDIHVVLVSDNPNPSTACWPLRLRAGEASRASDWLSHTLPTCSDSFERMFSSLRLHGLTAARPNADRLAVALTDEPDSSFWSICEAYTSGSYDDRRCGNNRENRIYPDAEFSSLGTSRGPRTELNLVSFSAEQRLHQAEDRLREERHVNRQHQTSYGTSRRRVQEGLECQIRAMVKSEAAWHRRGARIIHPEREDWVDLMTERLQALSEPDFTSRHYLSAPELTALRNGELMGVYVDGQLLGAQDYRYDSARRALLFNRPVRNDAEFRVRIAVGPRTDGSTTAPAAERLSAHRDARPTRTQCQQARNRIREQSRRNGLSLPELDAFLLSPPMASETARAKPSSSDIELLMRCSSRETGQQVIAALATDESHSMRRSRLQSSDSEEQAPGIEPESSPPSSSAHH